MLSYRSSIAIVTFSDVLEELIFNLLDREETKSRISAGNISFGTFSSSENSKQDLIRDLDLHGISQIKAGGTQINVLKKVVMDVVLRAFQRNFGVAVEV